MTLTAPGDAHLPEVGWTRAPRRLLRMVALCALTIEAG
jgi:hypothetical protein